MLLLIVLVSVCLTLSDAGSKPRSVKLGQPCSDRLNCSAAFSTCNDGKCQCSDVSQEQNGKCVPKHRTCPAGDALSTNEATVKCDPSYNPATGDPETPRAFRTEDGYANANGTCPLHYYCVAEAEMTYGNATGFCCPKPKHCPIGNPLTNSTCDYSELTDTVEFCPYMTHYCYREVVGNSPGNELCCERPCPSDDILKDGICQPPLQLGDSCTSEQQCEPVSAHCVNGTCMCTDDTVDFNGECQATYCLSTIDSLSPFKLPSGKIMKCSSTKECPEQAYCTDAKYCCPVPVAYCSDTSTYASPTKDRCDVDGPASQCGAKKKCTVWYYEFVNQTASGVGLCCAEN